MSERCERMSECPSTLICILRYSGPQCDSILIPRVPFVPPITISQYHSQFYLGVANRLFRIVLEDANLASDGHVEIPMQDADHVGDELPFVLQEGAVMTYGPEMKKKTDKIAIESFTSPRARE